MTPGAVSECVAPGADDLLVVTLDALVCGIHFPQDTAADDVAFKSLAVNLSDLAAMGAEPVAVQAVCESDPAHRPWRAAVAASLGALASGFQVAVHVHQEDGPGRRVMVQAMGHVPVGAGLTRDGARAGDRLWVSGTLGDAGAGLELARGLHGGAGAPDRAYLLSRLNRPSPRLALGRALRGIASAAIDVSDGVAGDAGHLARRSGVGIRISSLRLPLSAALERVAGTEAGCRLAAFAGDDYELLFTAAPGRDADVRRAARASATPVRIIGQAVAGQGVALLDAGGRSLAGHAFEHFGPPAGGSP